MTGDIMHKADFFISHASEDKQDFVKGLVDHLALNGAWVFYDEYSIRLGDSITESINNGIRSCNHAIIVLSKFFFEKRWPNAEFQALFNKSLDDNFKLFVIYHKVDHKEVSNKYPLLADKKGIDSSAGLEKITEELFRAIGKNTALGYLETKGIKRSKEELSQGFSISLYVGFPRLGDKRFDQVLFDFGKKDKFSSRIRLYIS